MADYIIRELREDDSPALIPLWKTIFGDSEDFIRAYFRLLPRLGRCAVAELEGKPVGMASALTGMALIERDGTRRRCGYVYAVAVDERARHLGMGAALTRGACETAMDSGAELMCTLPAEDSLYAWYEALMGVHCALRRRRFETEAKPGETPVRLNAEEYFSRREALLAGRPHLSLKPAAAELAQIFYETYGGGLFSVGGSICAGYSDGHELILRELISPDRREKESAAAAAYAMAFERASFFLPDPDGDKYIAATAEISPDCVWSFSFD